MDIWELTCLGSEDMVGTWYMDSRVMVCDYKIMSTHDGNRN